METKLYQCSGCRFVRLAVTSGGLCLACGDPGSVCLIADPAVYAALALGGVRAALAVLGLDVPEYAYMRLGLQYEYETKLWR